MEDDEKETMEGGRGKAEAEVREGVGGLCSRDFFPVDSRHSPSAILQQPYTSFHIPQSNTTKITMFAPGMCELIRAFYCPSNDPPANSWSPTGQEQLSKEEIKVLSITTFALAHSSY